MASSTSISSNSDNEKLLVQIASYNTNLQGTLGLPQDLVDWLSPTLEVARFLSNAKQAPDIVAVGFQELLPLHLGLSGFSGNVIDSRDALIRSQIEEHAPNKSRYTLVAKIVNVGVALLVYVRDDSLGTRVFNVQTQWTGCGPVWMGNKGAVGVRFTIRGSTESRAGEVFTFVNAHFTAHKQNLSKRIADYHHIVSTLLFPTATAFGTTRTNSNIYATSHLFFFGDLNFRLSLPPNHPLGISSARSALHQALNNESERENLKEYDQLLMERQIGNAFVALREGEFWKFKCTYKYKLNEIDQYSTTREPAWTDRIMFTTHTDSPNTPDDSDIQPVLYTSIPSYVASDHKPIVALLLVPSGSTTADNNPTNPTSSSSNRPSQSSSLTPPTLRLPQSFKPKSDPYWIVKRYTGRVLDRLVGLTWSLMWLFGFGNAAFGIGSFLFSILAWRWWNGNGGERASRASAV